MRKRPLPPLDQILTQIDGKSQGEVFLSEDDLEDLNGLYR
jgi:hypothetical protein